MTDFLTSDYFHTELTIADMEEAYEYYCKWCDANGQENEVSEIVDELGFESIDTGLIDHILYHAEIQGYEIP